MTNYGKLVLTKADGANQEFILNKEQISLGRSTTNDIVLHDGRVSRNHARISCAQDGLLLTDLNSANGTWRNRERISETKIQAGDAFEVGGCVIEYQPPTVDTDQELTLINTEAEFEQTLSQMSVPVSLNDTSQPRLAIHTPDRTWELPLIEEAYTIGRTADNQIVLDFAKVSRTHARLERKGDSILLTDLQSTNGTRVGPERIDKHRLQDGDMIQIGPVQLVFKDSFSKEEMTVVDGLDLGKQHTHAPVVFVPGIMGSQLWLGGERVWPNINLLLKHPEIFRYTENDKRLNPSGILNEMVIVPNLVTFDQYNILGDYLVEELGYERENNFLEFAYDWRQDVRQSAQQLATCIDEWKVNSPITLIGHSLGTLVSRYYVEKLGGHKKVGRLILMGGPHQGVPKIVANLLTGVDLLPFGLMGKKLTEIIETFPTTYQILPMYACGVDQSGKPIHFLEDESWVKPAYRHLWRLAREFRKELGMTSKVSTLSIFGYGLKTAAQLQVQSDPDGSFKKITIDVKPSGDTSVPESSAVLPQTEIHPVRQYHGTLFSDNDVKMRLKLELLQDR